MLHGVGQRVEEELVVGQIEMRQIDEGRDLSADRGQAIRVHVQQAQLHQLADVIRHLGNV